MESNAKQASTMPLRVNRDKIEVRRSQPDFAQKSLLHHSEPSEKGSQLQGASASMTLDAVGQRISDSPTDPRSRVPQGASGALSGPIGLSTA